MKLRTTIATLAAGLAVFGLAACGKKEGARPAASSEGAAPAAVPAKNPYAQAALTDEKMTKFIDSMKEEKNPLEFVFKQGGGMRSTMDMKAKEVEFNAYARKYGFRDYTEYIDTWGRIMVGQMQEGAAEMFKSVAEMNRKQIAEAEAKLKEPGLTAEQKQTYTEQIETANKSLADMAKTNENSLNEADLALVKKYGPQLKEAQMAARKGR